MRIVPENRRTVNVGDRFTRLSIIGQPFYVACKSHGSYHMVVCECDCGNITAVAVRAFANGNTQSCGCLNRDLSTIRSTKHGGVKTKLYRVFYGMRERCYNKKHTAWNEYGGRGITICHEWLDNFPAFQTWALENGYERGLQIDRRDNEAGYCPSNCRWVTRLVNMNNTRHNIFLMAFGEKKTMSQWSVDGRCKVKLETLRGRIGRGWNSELAMTKPAADWHRKQLCVVQ